MKLTTKQIAGMPEEYFGLPKDKRYPLPDKEHIVKAIQFFGYAKPEERKELASNINRRARELGVTVKVNNKSEFYKYIDKRNVLKESSEYIEEFHIGSLSPIVPLSGEIVQKSYPNENIDTNKKITEFIDCEDDEKAIKLLHEIYNIPTDNFDDVNSNILHNVAIDIEADKMSTSYSDINDIKLRMNDIHERLFNQLKVELNYEDRNIDLILPILNSFNNRKQLIMAFCYIASVDYTFFKKILSVYKIKNNEIAYLDINTNMDLVRDVKGVWLNPINVNVNFNDTEEINICYNLNENTGKFGLDLVFAVTGMLKRNNKIIDMINFHNHLFGLWINRKIKSKLFDGYLLLDNNQYISYVKLHEEPNVIYRLFAICDDNHEDDVPTFVPREILLVKISDKDNPNFYINLEKQLVYAKEITLAYKVFEFKLKEKVIEESSKLMKSLKDAMNKIKITKQGDIKINLSGTESYMDLYDKTHKMILLNKENNNIEALKENIAFLFLLISDIESRYIRNKDIDKESKEYKDAIKARGFAINELKQTMKIITKHDKHFNFMKYYEEKKYNDNVLTIDRNTIKGLKLLFRTIML